MFRHPKYYKELRKLRNKLDQVISETKPTGDGERAPGPALKPQASSFKPEATSSVIREPRYMDIGEVLEVQGPRALTMINVFLG